MTTPLNRTFLSYARQGLAGQITAPTGVTAALPPRADIAIQLAVNSRAPVSLDLQTYGPGDITGFDEGQVARSEPVPGATDFEADLLACVEFARPDLPWLLTPGAPDPANGRIPPWLALVVVTQQHSTVTAITGLPLPVLSCPLAELPDLSESWAWAHAQVTGAPGTNAGSLLSTPGAVSRLICPRRLAPGTAYVACVVPAFAAGAAAGLGQPNPAGPLSPAWGPKSPATMQLPVYYHWTFSTGLSGDFASLASQLRPRLIPAELGLRDIDISAADPEIPAQAPPDGVLGMSGAAGGGPSADTVPPAFRTGLLNVLAGGATGVGPPVYGGMQAGTGSSLSAAPQWLSELNLDPRHRAAASLGAQVVQNAQELLMASAWTQAAQLSQANTLLRGGQLARPVASTWHRKHFQGSAAGLAPGPATDRLIQLTGPAHGRILPPGTAQTVSAQVSASATVAATVSVPYRRVARPLGPLARRLGALPATPLPPPLTAITAGTLVATPPRPAPAGLVTLDSVINPPPAIAAAPGQQAAGGPLTYRTITPQLIASASPWWQGLTGGFTAPVDGYWSDLIIFRATTSGMLGWRVGQHLDFNASAASGWLPEQSILTGGGQVAAAGVYSQLGGTGTPFYSIVAVTVAPPATGHGFLLYLGSGLEATGQVQSWAQPVPIMQPTTGPVLAAAAHVYNASTTQIGFGEGTTMLLAWVEQDPSGSTAAHYAFVSGIGTLLGPSSSLPQPLPFTPAGDLGIAGGTIGPVAANASDVVIWWISGPPGARTAQYVIGWQFGQAGPASWSAPIAVPGTMPDTAVGLGAALTNISATTRPDLLLYYIEQVPAPAGSQAPPAFQGRYLIGWQLGPDGVPAGGWSQTRDIPGDWSGTAYGGSAAIASIDPARQSEIVQIGMTFQQQAESLQQALLGPAALPAPAPAPPPFTAGSVAAAVLGALDPAQTVPARLLSQINVAGAPLTPPASADPLSTLAVTPSFPQPMYAPLRDLAAAMVLPSARDLPPDTVTLIEGDPAFIESYLVGLNHEMSRLLAWRGYPTDGTGTYFQYFWDRQPGSAAGPDIPPIAAWDPAAPLGGHAASVGASGMLTLLIRGALTRRWPDLIVRASRAAVAPGSTVPNPTDEWRYPVFSGRVEPDISFYGFDLTTAEARSSAGPPADPGWFFVVSEQPALPRFGLEPLPEPAVYGGAPATWASLNWGELATDAASYAALTHISAVNPPQALNGLALGGVTFGHNAAHMAAVTLRKPFQVAFHADQMLQGL